VTEPFGAFPTVPVGPFDVAALEPDDIVARAASALPAGRVTLLFALHVGGLAAWDQPDAIAAYRRGDMVYADGVSITLAMRMISGARVHRSPTTDIGAQLLRAATSSLDRRPRVALFGGPDGLARAAGQALDRFVDVVETIPGFEVPDAEVVHRLNEAAPDVVFVGLGSPWEQIWLHERIDQLPAAVYITCGGWFGFLAGEETRAPRALRAVGMEWLWRVAQNPRTKAKRYVTGVLHLLRAIRTGRRRRRSALLAVPE